MIRKIKIHNIIDIIGNSNFMKPINVLIKKNYENIYLNVSYDLSKFDGSRKMKVRRSKWYHPRMLSLNRCIISGFMGGFM